jgi:hypothetical protein
VPDFFNQTVFTTMKVIQLVEAMDAQILQGDIIGAFETFAADNCVTHSTPSDITHSKAQKKEALQWFFNSLTSVNRVERIAVKTGADFSESQFVFDFNDRSGNTLVYQEVIRRTWKDGKMVEEQYLQDQTIEDNNPAASKTKVAVKPAAKSKETAKPATKKAGEPAPAKTASAKETPVAKQSPAPAKTTVAKKVKDQSKTGRK